MNTTTTIESIKNEVSQLYETIAEIQNSGINVPQRIDVAIKEVFGEYADDNLLAYIQGLLIMAERFAGSPYGDIVRYHIIDVVSTTSAEVVLTI